MSKKAPQRPSHKIVYKTDPMIISLVFVLCAVCLYVVVYQWTVLDQVALSDQIQIMQRENMVIPVAPSVTSAPGY